MLLNMKLARVKKGFSQQKLADISNTSILTVNQLELGKRKIDLVGYGTLNRIASALDLTVDELIQESEV